MLQDFKQATITNIIQETAHTRRFTLNLGEEKALFKPGQFITLDLPISDKKNKRLRSYSIASAPSATNELELVIVLLEGGLGTTYLFNECSIGTLLNYRGPLGHFTLPDPLPKDLFLVCTGTGIAPFRSMAHYLAHESITSCNINLIMGTRTSADLLYHAELEALAAAHSWFNYVPTLSREQWQGKQGYVHDVYKELAADKKEAHFMLCGWRNMIDEARKTLSELGYSKEQIHFELYG
jgi:ferredoxin-NADP reductase